MMDHSSAANLEPIRIGMAGWSLPTTLQPRFPGAGTHLQRYAAVLPAVEINSSFYRPHLPATYARWRDSVPADFRFSVKLPREITHFRRLKDIEAPLESFLNEVLHLGDRLGCVLVQMPPSLVFDPDAAANLFGRLRVGLPEGIGLACEARHRSWFGEEAAALLGEERVARVIADPPVVSEMAPVIYRDLLYIRLHGSPEIYHSNYADDYLQKLAPRLLHHQQRGRRVWCIFDNTASGAALPNALATLERVQRESDVDQRGGGAGGAPGGGGGGMLFEDDGAV
ncbi:DUF72 domain-containing protein [Noviherbaspirillum pedocola]|uniref:DUF72 domain-containing protein n=1 Tax=Noviherbaspirillum pedocola TaxID=2801341 RepID=A0A934SXU7_9BURK|nr:DUF72 domain-containing protein [Noviherbaspirillum pedocola]MBK4737523.1 DUF72 domain-containing protein [Noviherbaspirillum pedocola]